MAADVKLESKATLGNAFRCCTLCRDGKEYDHPVHKCPNYETPQEKIEKLTKLGFCEKCCGTHPTKECRFRFNNKCGYCQSWHFSFLCTGIDKGIEGQSRASQNSYHDPKFRRTEGRLSEVEKSKSSKKNKEKETQNGAIWMEAKSSINCGNSILPTFTCKLENEDLLRCLKDTGSQANFISEKVAEDYNLKVLEKDVSLKVNGFNMAKSYITKLVEVPLGFGGEEFNLQAICIPSINTNLTLPGLNKIVKRFDRVGYTFADKYLLDGGDNISNIDFVLGTDSLHILQLTMKVFGDRSSPSMYYNTSDGIMLAGRIENFEINCRKLFIENENFNEISKEPDMLQKGNRGEVWLDCHHMTSSLAQHINITNEKAVGESKNLSELTIQFSVLDDKGKLVESELQKATNSILENECSYVLNLESPVPSDVENISEVNQDLINFTYENCDRDAEGRLIMPLLWNSKVCHLLGKNLNMSKQILWSNYKKLSHNPEHLLMVDKVFAEQEQNGIIEKIDNLPEFLREHPNHSFLPHMAVFKPDRDTTKCRCVFLSNLCEKKSDQLMTISHNQAILPGPCLNFKVATSLVLLRFGKKLICFDLAKAFLQIALREVDQNRLLFLWYKNIEKGNLEIVAYRNKRLSFGLRCSPTMLMLALYKILILDTDDDPTDIKDLKRSIYHLMYVDNGAYSTDTSESLFWAYEKLDKIFEPYGFKLQQFCTNDQELQDKIDATCNKVTSDNVKLFGLLWNRKQDTLSTKPLYLDREADTKRLILKTIASNFDLFNFAGPLLNRSRIFLHDLQCQKGLSWDSRLSADQLREWRNISSQLNTSLPIDVKRFIGRKDSKYKLIAFTDSSNKIYGAVIYIQDMDSGEVSFVLAKNRIVNTNLNKKSIPSLEFQAIVLGTETLIDLQEQLGGTNNVLPVNVVQMQLYSDSLVSLSWLNSYSTKLDKMSKRSVYIMNRLDRIGKLCERFPIKFSFVSGIENPADFITRPVSYALLMRSNYFDGPKFLKDKSADKVCCEGILDVTIPNPNIGENLFEKNCLEVGLVGVEDGSVILELVERISCFDKLVAVLYNVFTFINKLKTKVYTKRTNSQSSIQNKPKDTDVGEIVNLIVAQDQRKEFPEILQYFNSKEKTVKNIPNLVSQLNIFPDQKGILRVKSKFDRGKPQEQAFPILLSKNSSLAKKIIMTTHKRMAHSGCYSILAALRKKFYIPHFYSAVKLVLKGCIHCKRFNNKTIQLNQNAYRNFRSDPPKIPYRTIFVDHIGPYWVSINGKKEKVWLLCITCLWSRAINLEICYKFTVESYLRALQLHMYKFGLPSLCLSDAGSQLVAGGNIVVDFLKDPETKKYLKFNNIKSLEFKQYTTGNHELGSLIETCVKMVRKLIYGAIKNMVLSFLDFDFIVQQTVHLVNRRPVGFKEQLRNIELNDFEPITPEMIIHGYELPSVNIIPQLQPEPDDDPEWQNENRNQAIESQFKKLKVVRNRLNELYHNEFLSTLVTQATDRKERYLPVKHNKLKPGDVVLIKEPFLKPSTYPMALVKTVEVNEMDEVTNVKVLKGRTKELVNRHVSSLVPIITDQNIEPINPGVKLDSSDNKFQIQNKHSKPRRKAALEAEKSIQLMTNQNIIQISQ